MRHVCSARRRTPLFYNGRQGHQAGVLPQVRGIHQQGDIRDIFPAARTNCCGDRIVCKQPDSYYVDHPVVRGQRHDQATFGLLGFADSPEARLEARQSSHH
jgi:hypothetical protein